MTIQIMVVACWLVTLLFLNWAGRARADHRNKVDQTPEPTGSQASDYQRYIKQTNVLVWLTRILFLAAIFGTFMEPRLAVIALTLSWVTSYATVYFLHTADQLR